MDADKNVEEYSGYPENPGALVQQAFEKVAQTEDMLALPFYHRDIQVKSIDFQLFEEQWIGVVLTPWMMNIVILPGPTQIWPQRQIGDKLGLQFPRGKVLFIVGEMDEIGQYLSCSVKSPLDQHIGALIYEQLAQDVLKDLLGQKEPDSDAPENPKRRFIKLKPE